MLDQFLATLPATSRGPAARSIGADGARWGGAYFDWLRGICDVVHKDAGIEILEDSDGFLYMCLCRHYAFELTPVNMVGLFGSSPVGPEKMVGSVGWAIRACGAVLNGEGAGVDKARALGLVLRLMRAGAVPDWLPVLFNTRALNGEIEQPVWGFS